jgi:hypothetical protein
MTLQAYLERDDAEITVTVDYSFSRARRGARDSLCGVRGAGPPLEPDEDEEIEIQSVTDENGKEVELTADETDKIEQQCWDDIADRE